MKLIFYLNWIKIREDYTCVWFFGNFFFLSGKKKYHLIGVEFAYSQVSSSVAHWPSYEEVEKVHHGPRLSPFVAAVCLGAPLSPLRSSSAASSQSPVDGWAQRRIAHGASPPRARRNGPPNNNSPSRSAGKRLEYVPHPLDSGRGTANHCNLSIPQPHIDRN
jgi:hypothetical protein